MTREQLIAWCILEGWEARRDGGSRDPAEVSLVKGRSRISQTLHYFPESRTVITGVFDRRGDWKEISNKMLERAYEVA